MDAVTVGGSSGVMRCTRVFHLLTSFDTGGTERQALELLARLDAERYYARLGVLRYEGVYSAQAEELFSEVPSFPHSSFYDPAAMRQAIRLRDLLKRENMDILHAHDFYTSLLGGIAGHLAGKRVLVSQRYIRLSDRRVHAWGQRWIYRLAHRILVNSEAVRDQILKGNRVSPEKIVVIRNGVIPPEQAMNGLGLGGWRRIWREKLLKELGLDSTVRLIGVVARLKPEKGHRYLIEAAQRVCTRLRNAHFVLVGDGPLDREIGERSAQLGLRDHVHLLGFRQDSSQLPGAFDLAVLPSLHEGLPNAVLEAMAAGVAVVGTAAGGTRELIDSGRTGWLVPPADPESLAERILFALEHDEERVAVASRGRDFALDAYGMTRMVRQVEQLYDAMLCDRT
jgi:glycosyltransferase involved in cell wall biosynthesis